MGRRTHVALIFAAAFAVSAACGDTVVQGIGGGGCPPASTAGNGGDGAASSTTSSSTGTAGAGGAGGTGGGLPPTPEEVNIRLHGCSKVPYAALGELLRRRGVDLDDLTPGSAGAIYASAWDAYGAQRRDSLRPETSFPSVPSLTWLFDLCLAAAPEIIANIDDPALAPACVADGDSFAMFDAAGQCTHEAVSCLIGRPAKPEHLTLCNQLVAAADETNVDDVELKQILAVGTLLYAAHGCE